MHEILPVPGVSNDLSSDSINFFARNSVDTGSNPCGLSFHQHAICRSDIRGDVTSDDASGDIRAVSVHRATKIAQHYFSGLNDPVTGVMVRACCVFSCGNDCEVHLLVTPIENALRQICRHLRFGTSDQGNHPRLQLACDLINGSSRSPQCCDFNL